MRKSVMKIHPMTTFSRTIRSRPNHQLFINFRGKELRHGIISHLVAAFILHGINFFIDKNEEKGKDLKHLFKRIKQSKIAIAFFSKRYSQSKWCLNELVKMHKLAKKRKLIVFPIFYKVKAYEVRYQKGAFGDNFCKLAKTSSYKRIMRWKEALKFVSNKIGLPFGDNSSEAEFIDEIIKELERILNRISIAKKKDQSQDVFLKNKRQIINGFYELPRY